MRHPLDYMQRASGIKDLPFGNTPEEVMDTWTTSGLETFGVAVLGTPDDAIASIERLVEKTGGFGTFLLFVHDIMNWDDMRRSFELFASEVIPHFRRANTAREDSLNYARDNAENLMGGLVKAVNKAAQDYFGDDREVHVR
jgi:limonene 1,2-monooxygenase